MGGEGEEIEGGDMLISYGCLVMVKVEKR